MSGKNLLKLKEVQAHTGQSILESDEILKQVVKHDPYAIAIYDNQMRYLAASDHWLTDYNVQEQDIIGKSHYEVFPDIPQRWKDIHRRCLEGYVEYNHDDYFERADGTIIYNRWEMRPWYRSDGTIGGAIAYTEVTTERKLAEQARKEIIERYDLASSAAGFGFWDWNISRNSLIWDERMFELYSVNKQDFKTCFDNWIKLVHSEDRLAFKQEIDRSLSENKDYYTEFRIVWPNGSIHHIRAYGRLVRNAENTAIRMSGVNYDITERKRAENEKLNLQDQLQKAQKLESLGILAGGIAHDFNNLMSGLFGYMELAKISLDKSSHKETAATLNKAMEALSRARELTRQLLTFSKGGVPIKKLTNIADILKDVANISLSGSNLAVNFKIARDLLSSEIDSNQIIQALDNILINAKEAMPSGGTICIHAENVKSVSEIPALLEPGLYVHISVIDSGCGISPENMPLLFDPFFTTKVHGHGLGLPMAYSIIKNHGGLITAESKQGKGSVFNIYLPASADKIQSDLNEQVAGKHLGAGKILLMDDEDIILEVMTKMLAQMGCTTVQTRSGEEALAEYQSALKTDHPFSIVILDLTVRGAMGGIETIKRLLEIDPCTTAILSSGYSEDPAITNPEQYGFKAAIMKPYKFSDVAEVLEKLSSNFRYQSCSMA